MLQAELEPPELATHEHRADLVYVPPMICTCRHLLAAHDYDSSWLPEDREGLGPEYCTYCNCPNFDQAFPPDPEETL